MPLPEVRWTLALQICRQCAMTLPELLRLVERFRATLVAVVTCIPGLCILSHLRRFDDVFLVVLTRAIAVTEIRRRVSCLAGRQPEW